VKAAIQKGETSAKIDGFDFSLELVAMDHDTDSAGQVANAIRRALRGNADEGIRARLCGKYDAAGTAVLNFLKGRAAAFIVRATGGDVMAVAGLRQLTQAQLQKTYTGTQQSPQGSKVAEIGMVYTDADCGGMSLVMWTLEAVIRQAYDWGMDELVLEATPDALGLYKAKFGFKVHAGASESTGSTPMSRQLSL